MIEEQNGDHLIYGGTNLGIRSKTGANITIEPAGTTSVYFTTDGNFNMGGIAGYPIYVYKAATFDNTMMNLNNSGAANCKISLQDTSTTYNPAIGSVGNDLLIYYGGAERFRSGNDITITNATTLMHRKSGSLYFYQRCDTAPTDSKGYKYGIDTSGNFNMFFVNDADNTSALTWQITRTALTNITQYFHGSQIVFPTATVGLEIGSSAGANSPYIDFHSGSSPVDYDVRGQVTGGNGTNGQGNYSLYAANFIMSQTTSKILLGASSLHSGATPSTLYITQPAGTGPQITLDAYATSSNFTNSRANGTLASPSGVLSGEPISYYGCKTYTSAGAWTGNIGAIRFLATENHTGTGQGTSLEIATTAIGATGRSAVGLFQAGVGLTVTGKVHSDTTAKFFANFNGTGTPAIKGTAHNVSSITDNGVGDYTINFSTALPSANYALSGILCDILASSSRVIIHASTGTANPTTKTTTAVRFGVGWHGGTFDCPDISIVGFGI